ncbi:hypothetical protein ACHAWF_005591 [Thalassiosira exigua]
MTRSSTTSVGSLSNLRPQGFTCSHEQTFAGGLTNLSKLVVPINKGNYHWLFAVADFTTRRIELYDSLGRHCDNEVYMRSLRKYIYDDTHHSVGPRCICYGDWCCLWECQDMSTHCLLEITKLGRSL